MASNLEEKITNITIQPLVNIKQGQIKGSICDDNKVGKYFSFQGIPYAKPPIGKLRFKAPVPVAPWTGIFDATESGNQSMQRNSITRIIEGSEDCLNLNVYTTCLPLPDKKNTILKPVMVFIHGGSFISGSNHKNLYGPELFLAEDVVLVVINYRLGILGFLSIDDPKLDVPGNAAFKDMVLALKWVQMNIHHFAGDRNNVTVFGNSAGAAGVHFLVLSPMAKGLFHKAICQSGSALSSWAYTSRNAKIIGKELGFDESLSNEKEIFQYLCTASAEEIVKAQFEIERKVLKGNRFRYIGAVVEPSNWKGEKFFSEHPLKILQFSKYNKVPLLMGYNSSDGMLIDAITNPKNNSIYWTQKELNVPEILQVKIGSALSKHLGDEIVEFYFGHGEISRETHVQALYDLVTDDTFLEGIYNSVKNHRKTSTTPLYMYRFSLETELNFFKKFLQISLPGVCHADELGYMFKMILTETPEPGTIADIAQRRVTRLWTNFAKYSNPTPYLDPLLDIIWKPITNPEQVYYLDIGETLKLNCNPEHKRMQFWDKIYTLGRQTSKL